MKAVVHHGVRDIGLDDVPDHTIQHPQGIDPAIDTRAPGWTTVEPTAAA